MLKTLTLILVMCPQLANSQDSLESLTFMVKDQLIFIPIRVNHSETLNFLFDTGAEVTVVDNKVADKLNLISTAESQINTAGKKIEAKNSAYNTISLGQLTMDSQSIEVFSIQHLSDYLKIQIDGIIGYGLLKNYVVSMDIDKKKMILYDTASYQYDYRDDQVELIDLEHHHFGFPITFNPKNKKSPITLIFKVDTGFSGHLVLHNHAIERHQLLMAKKYKKNRGFGADSTTTTNLRGKFREVAFAGRSWKNVPVVFEIDPINIEANKSSKSSGLIGQALLLDFNIVYDYPGQFIYLESRKKLGGH